MLAAAQDAASLPIFLRLLDDAAFRTQADFRQQPAGFEVAWHVDAEVQTATAADRSYGDAEPIQVDGAENF